MLSSLPLVFTFLPFLPLAAWAQDDVTQLPLANNALDLVGTWVSQSQGVITGPNFVNPLNFSFNLSPNTGVSYSFTQDGYFEEAWYRFTSNGSSPNCVVGVVQWQHGKYYPLSNGSIFMIPFPTDGRQQVQDTCASQSNIIQQFNSTVYMSTWEMRMDSLLGQQLYLYQFNGVPVQPLYRYSTVPIMLPTQTLTANVTVGQVLSGSAMALAVIKSVFPILAVTLIACLAGLGILL